MIKGNYGHWLKEQREILEFISDKPISEATSLTARKGTPAASKGSIPSGMIRVCAAHCGHSVQDSLTMRCCQCNQDFVPKHPMTERVFSK